MKTFGPEEIGEDTKIAGRVLVVLWARKLDPALTRHWYRTMQPSVPETIRRKQKTDYWLFRSFPIPGNQSVNGRESNTAIVVTIATGWQTMRLERLENKIRSRRYQAAMNSTLIGLENPTSQLLGWQGWNSKVLSKKYFKGFRVISKKFCLNMLFLPSGLLAVVNRTKRLLRDISSFGKNSEPSQAAPLAESLLWSLHG